MVLPAPLPPEQQLVSDMMLDRLRTTEHDIGRHATETVALGNLDGCARYLDEPE